MQMKQNRVSWRCAKEAYVLQWIVEKLYDDDENVDNDFIILIFLNVRGINDIFTDYIVS